MLRSTLIRTGAIVTLCGAAALTGCDRPNTMAERAMMGSNVQFDPDSGELYRLYAYYPNEQVYQSVYHYTWYWQDESGWHYGRSLPESQPVSDYKVIVTLPTSRPFMKHKLVCSEHPSTEMLYAQLADQESARVYEAFASVHE